jgi:hypothetical protein
MTINGTQKWKFSSRTPYSRLTKWNSLGKIQLQRKVLVLLFIVAPVYNEKALPAEQGIALQ